MKPTPNCNPAGKIPCCWRQCSHEAANAGPDEPQTWVSLQLKRTIALHGTPPWICYWLALLPRDWNCCLSVPSMIWGPDLNSAPWYQSKTGERRNLSVLSQTFPAALLQHYPSGMSGQVYGQRHRFSSKKCQVRNASTVKSKIHSPLQQQKRMDNFLQFPQDHLPILRLSLHQTLWCYRNKGIKTKQVQSGHQVKTKFIILPFQTIPVQAPWVVQTVLDLLSHSLLSHGV